MSKRGEEQSIKAPGAAALPWSSYGAIPQAGRTIAVAGDAIVDFVLEPGGGTTAHLCVEVIDTIGAGDAFGAAWLGGWVADGLGRPDLSDFEAIVRTAKFAAIVAARTCERAGAEPSRAAKVDAEWCFAQ